MTVLIIEDEQLGIERLVKHLNEIDPSVRIVGTAGSIKSSVQWLNANQHPDLILMDIELSDGQSFDVFNQVNVKSTVVFTTSYDEYALKAFRVNSIDYLLKPVKKEELRNSLDKFRLLKSRFSSEIPNEQINITSLLNELKQQQARPFRSRFLAKLGTRLVSVDISEIAYFYVDDRLVFFRSYDKTKYIIDYNMDELEQMLDPHEFFRANRGCIIHIKSIGQIHNFFNGKLKLELVPAFDKEVLISREKSADFKSWLGK
jgi:DNA-binding LytR/AlgR family response regulator